MPYWAVGRLQPGRERLALHCLGLGGYEVYYPRLRTVRRSPSGRKIEARPPLFPAYCFCRIELQWSSARYAPGMVGLIMNGSGPAHVSDQIIDEIRQREVGGLIELPRARALRHGDRVRILQGPFRGHLAIFADMKPHQRVEVLLSLLGSQQRVTLAAEAVERYDQLDDARAAR